jgi:adenylosuccinate synthase
MVNGIDEIAITNLDGLDTVKTIKVCVAYKLDGKQIDVPPTDFQRLFACEPVYIELPGWQTPTDQCKTFAELPQNAQAYALKIAELTGGKLIIVSTGARRDQTILL